MLPDTDHRISGARQEHDGHNRSDDDQPRPAPQRPQAARRAPGATHTKRLNPARPPSPTMTRMSSPGYSEEGRSIGTTGHRRKLRIRRYASPSSSAAAWALARDAP